MKETNNMQPYQIMAHCWERYDSKIKNDWFDKDTPNITHNDYLPDQLSIKLVNGKIVHFINDLAYDSVIKSNDCEITYIYALLLNNKVVAIGEEHHYDGGLTHFMIDEENPQEVIANLSIKSKQHRSLYNKIHQLKPITKEDCIPCPQTLYKIINVNSHDTYFINDNKDGTYSLWLNYKELINTNNLVDILNTNYFKSE